METRTRRHPLLCRGRSGGRRPSFAAARVVRLFAAARVVRRPAVAVRSGGGRPAADWTVALALLAGLPAIDPAEARGVSGFVAPAKSAAAPPPAPVRRYVRDLLRRYDADADGRLQAAEWQALRGTPAAIDRDGDGMIAEDELARHVMDYASRRRLGPPREAAEQEREAGVGASPSTLEAAATEPPRTYFVPQRYLPEGVPEWFESRDANGDGQLSLAEYAPTAEAQQVAQFERLDGNQDGFVTAQEATRPKPSEAEDASPKRRRRAAAERANPESAGR